LLTRLPTCPGEPGNRLDWRKLEPRTRQHLRAGRVVRRTGLIRQRAQRNWKARAEVFFAEYDVLITPMLATMPAKAQQWCGKSWLANALPAIRLTAFLGPWDLAGYPVISLPAGRHPSGLPIGVQLVAPPGGEARLLTVAAQLEALNPWPRTARR
jgi:amidase